MKTTVTIQKEVDIRFLEVKARPRNWSNAVINGKELNEDDEDAPAESFDFPCKEGEFWCPIIDVDSGIIEGWPKGVTASVHFKVCDDGSYFLKDKEWVNILKIEQNYVPGIMSPGGKGYGDYIIMDIDENGKIEDWDADFDSFKEEIED